MSRPMEMRVGSNFKDFGNSMVVVVVVVVDAATPSLFAATIGENVTSPDRLCLSVLLRTSPIILFSSCFLAPRVDNSRSMSAMTSSSRPRSISSKEAPCSAKPGAYFPYRGFMDSSHDLTSSSRWTSDRLFEDSSVDALMTGRACRWGIELN